MRTLYLHVGWSKTGTSAIQKQIQSLKNEFLKIGILYPQKLQWSDHSHHPFALAFMGSISGYDKKMTGLQAINLLKEEMNESNMDNVLISSELSPYYFDNQYFAEFVESHFDAVKVIFTVRRPSEFILSLFNQLIKDSMVRYKQSLFFLTLDNLAHMNYYHVIKKWENKVTKANIIVVPYSTSVVNDFLQLFDIKKGITQKEKNTSTVNNSLPTELLLILQEQGKNANSSEYTSIKNSILSNQKIHTHNLSQEILFSRDEQMKLDAHYTNSHLSIEREYLNAKQLFPSKQYQDIYVYSKKEKNNYVTN